MNSEIINLLNKIEAHPCHHEDSIFTRYRKLANNDIELFKELVGGRFTEYIEFMKYINGFSFRDLYLATFDEIWWTVDEHIMCFGWIGSEYNHSTLCLNKNNGKYYILYDEKTIKAEYESFDEMIIKLLKEVIDRPSVPGVDDKWKYI